MASRYTNAVLTVIAACLVVLVVKALFGSEVANADPATSAVQKVNIVEIGGWELLSRPALPVEFDSGPIPVEIAGGNRTGGCGCP